jgi:hypothetical protein
VTGLTKIAGKANRFRFEYWAWSIDGAWRQARRNIPNEVVGG